MLDFPFLSDMVNNIRQKGTPEYAISLTTTSRRSCGPIQTSESPRLRRSTRARQPGFHGQKMREEKLQMRQGRKARLALPLNARWKSAKDDLCPAEARARGAGACGELSRRRVTHRDDVAGFAEAIS